jgi:uncharacterized protein
MTWAPDAWLELVVIVGAMTLGGFVKGATGVGLPQITIPVMAIFLGVEHAVVVMAIPGVVTNAWLFWRHRSHLRATRDLPVLVGAGIVGTVVGTLVLDVLDPGLLGLVLAGVILLYVVIVIVKSDLAFPPGLTRYTSPPVGLLAGLMQGSTGMSGPVVSTYLHGYRLGKEVFVISVVTLFQVFTLAQAITLAQLGLYSSTRLVESLLALLPLMAAVPLGAWFSSRISRAAFDRLVIAILAFTATKLLYDSLTGAV